MELGFFSFLCEFVLRPLFFTLRFIVWPVVWFFEQGEGKRAFRRNRTFVREMLPFLFDRYKANFLFRFRSRGCVGDRRAIRKY